MGDRGPRVERQAATLTALFALATLAALGEWLVRRWNTHHNSWLEDLFGIVNVPVAHSLISVSGLAVLTFTLIGRKRVGLVLVAAAQVLGIYAAAASLGTWGPQTVAPDWSGETGSHVLDIASIVGGVVMLWWCFHLRRAFPARLQPGSWLQAATGLVTGLLAAVGVTWVLLELNVPGSVPVRWHLIGAALGRSLGDADLIDRATLSAVPEWIPQITSVVVSITLLLSVWLFLRSARLVNAWSPERELTIRRLLADGDPDSLGYFATRRDKASILSASGDAALTYRVLCGVSLASGDPIGARRHWPEVIAAWKAEARQFGWVPAVLGASEHGARAYSAAGLNPISLGDEAVLEADHFSLNQPAMTPVRHAVKRARRAGVSVTFRRQEEIGPEEIAELEAAAEDWRGDEPERGFSMALNRLGDPADFNLLIGTARDPEGRLLAVLSFVPWGRAGASLDLMRRRPDAPNGVVELVVAELMRAAGTLGVRRVSLNFCMFRKVYADAARLGAGTLTRLNYTVLGSLDRFWQLERLYRSNQKYAPEWRPRYICYDGRVSLPLVAIAAGMAEGFIPESPLRRHETPDGLGPADLERVRDLARPALQGEHCRRSDLEMVRLDHAARLADAGRDPWPVGCPAPDQQLEDLAALPLGHEVSLAGRIVGIRDHGGVLFAVLADREARAQAVLERATTTAFEEFAGLVDSGDLVRLEGFVGKSRSGELSVLVSEWQLLAKSLHSLPFGALHDPAVRVRRRATDLIVNADQAEALRHRSAVVRTLRETLEADGYLEVETPMLHTVHGGASARPFRTFSNAYGMDLSLRIAPELHLKRLVVAGMGPVFEIGRNFRNEGVDGSHNPEFTALEAYRPYADYTVMRTLAERLVRGAAVAVHGAELLPLGGPGAALVDVSGPWRVVPVLEAVSAATGVGVTLDTDFDRLLALAREHGVPTRGDMGPGALVEGLYAAVVEPATTMPTFYVDFPRETSPLARAHRSCPGLVERWDLVVGGVEIGTAYSELTDPVDQRARFTEQSLRAAAGDLEAMSLDEAFLHDLELGMPPTGGLGLGVDRLVMTVLGTPIRTVLAFPFVRPRQLD